MNKLIILDGNALVHRAYHALPDLTSAGQAPVNALYGFLLAFFRIVKELRPTHIAAAFDVEGPTFRHKEYKDYKGTRPKAPQELYDQIPKIKDMLRQFRVCVIEKQGFEADDLIGTLAKNARADMHEIVLVSSDNDLLQLVGNGTKVLLLKKGIKNVQLFDKKAVQERYEGLGPAQIVDMKALRGDPSDNIPGVAGIGEKTAVALLTEYTTLENLYTALEKNMPPKAMKHTIAAKLIAGKDQALLSQKLARIDCQVPYIVDLSECRWGEYSEENVLKELERYNFKTLVAQLKGIKAVQEEKQEVQTAEHPSTHTPALL